MGCTICGADIGEKLSGFTKLENFVNGDVCEECGVYLATAIEKAMKYRFNREMHMRTRRVLYHLNDVKPCLMSRWEFDSEEGIEVEFEWADLQVLLKMSKSATRVSVRGRHFGNQIVSDQVVERPVEEGIVSLLGGIFGQTECFNCSNRILAKEISTGRVCYRECPVCGTDQALHPAFRGRSLAAGILNIDGKLVPCFTVL